MTRTHPRPSPRAAVRMACAILLVLNPGMSPPARAEDDERPRTDRHGDPLPEGAIARLGTTRFRHGGWARAVDFSPDGKLVASGGDDCLIRLWDRASGKEVRRLIGHASGVGFVAFLPDGKHLISATDTYSWNDKDSSVRLWDVGTGKEVRRLPVGGLGVRDRVPLGDAALSRDGKTLAAGYSGRAFLVDVRSGRNLGVCTAPKGEKFAGSLYHLCFSPDGTKLAAFFMGVGHCLFEVKTRRLLWTNADEEVNSGSQHLAWSPDGKTVAAIASGKRPLRLLDAATGKELWRSRGDVYPFPPFAFSPDGRQIFSSTWGKKTVTVWDAANGKRVGEIAPLACGLLDMDFSPDGKTLAVAGGGAIRFWDVATAKPLPSPDGARARLNGVAVSPDGKTLLTSSLADATPVRTWDVVSGRQIACLRSEKNGWRAALAPDGKTFAACRFGERPILADVATGKVLRECRGKGKPGGAATLTFSPDGKLLAGANSPGMTVHTCLWDVTTGEEVATLPAISQRDATAPCLVFTPDGRFLAVGGSDGVIHLCDVAARKEVRRFECRGVVSSVAVSPEGQRIAAVTERRNLADPRPDDGAGRAIRVWDVATGKLLRQIDGPTRGNWCVAWSPDGRMLATGGEDSLVRLWEVATGKQRAALSGHAGSVTCLTFTADGGRLVSGSADTTALVWDLAAVARPHRPPAPADFPRLWDALAGDDAEKAFRTIAAFHVAPKQSVDWLKGRLRPAPSPDPQRLARLVADLNSAKFAVRERAVKELKVLGDFAAPALRKALAAKPSLELRRRAEELLRHLDHLSGDRLRAVRAVEALEHTGTPEARRLLKALADGAPAARLTREAKAALKRLDRHAGGRP